MSTAVTNAFVPSRSLVTAAYTLAAYALKTYTRSMAKPMMTVREMPEFLTAAKGLISDAQRETIVEMLARDPECGDIIPETGGVRKVRVALAGRGKRGGGRVVYYFHSQTVPLVIFTIYAKNAKDNLTAAQRKALAAVVSAIKAEIDQ